MALSRPGRPAPVLPALGGGIVVLSVREGMGVGKGGAGSRGDRAAGRARPRPSSSEGRPDRPITAPPRTRAPRELTWLRGGAAPGVSGAEVGRSRRAGRLGPFCAVGGRAECGHGEGQGGEGADAAQGLPWKVLLRLPASGRRVGDRPGLGAGRESATPVRHRLLRGRERLRPSWEARGVARPRGSLLRISNEWTPRRLRGGAEPRGKTSLESRLRSHDGGRGGENDKWRKRMGDGPGVNLETLPPCDRAPGLGRQFQSPPSNLYAAAPGVLKQNKKNPGEIDCWPGFLWLL